MTTAAEVIDSFFGCSSFEERTVFAMTPSHLHTVTTWLNGLGPELGTESATRAVFGLMMMHADSGEMLSKSAVDYVMRDASAQFVDSLRTAVTGDALGFVDVFTRCRGLMMAWRKRDAPLTLRFLLDDVVLAKSDGRSPEAIEKLFDQILSVGGVEAETRARRRHGAMESVSAEDFEKRLADAYRRAFWDSLKEEVAGTAETPPSFERLFQVLQELKDALKALVAHSERQKALIDERFDVTWIKQQADHQCLSTALIHQTMRWVSERIVMYQAAADTAAQSTPLCS